MRRAWWVAGLFLIPSLGLTLLLNAALSLGHGLGSPIVWVGVLVVPLVAGGRGLRRALARGLYALAALCLSFAAVVCVRVWTEAGGPVLAREGLLDLMPWALGAGAVAASAALALSRDVRSRPRTSSPD